jgi:uncharacterized protein
MRKLTLILLLLLLIPFASAKQGSIKLLAVTEKGDELQGAIADLDLEIAEGRGRVFIESFPLSKLDTQITTRFAKQVACHYLDTDCSKYDFFYTIRASSATVGGPSAGAATTVLTIALLDDLNLDSSTAVTGTINSGNLIGPVGGLKQKIDAAASAGIKKVLIPIGESFSSEENETIDFIKYAESKNISLVEISNINEALHEFTGKSFENNVSFEVNKEYTNTMKLLAEDLCEKSNDVFAKAMSYIYNSGPISNKSLEFETDAINMTQNAQEAFDAGFYYSAASFCYGAAVRFDQLYLTERNFTFSELNDSLSENTKTLFQFESQVDKKKIETIADLEAYMIVKQRISEARENLENLEEAIKEKDKDAANSYLANAVERANSAKSWSSFFGKPGIAIKIDNDALKNSCTEKISEAEERYDYVSLFLPGLDDIRSEIVQAYTELNKKSYALCLFKASIAKADADVILSTMSVMPEKILLLLDQKLNSAKNVIAGQTQNGIFPIFGYSYYEYANTLKSKNKQSALLYAEYSIELSNLDIYFEKAQKPVIHVNYFLIWFFVLGFVAGVVFSKFVLLRKKKRKKP